MAEQPNSIIRMSIRRMIGSDSAKLALRAKVALHRSRMRGRGA